MEEEQKKKYCFDCEEEISEETLEDYPDTEICGDCIATDNENRNQNNKLSL